MRAFAATSGGRSPLAIRAPLLAAAMASLLLALLGGLVRLDLELPAATADLALVHGPLMIVGFLGTVIALERAVALGGAAFVAPVLSAASGAALVAGAEAAAPALAVAASVALFAVFVALLARSPTLHGATMVVSAAAWLAGNVLWAAGWPIFRVVPWWAGFLVAMIAGERLELTRLRRVSRAARASFLASLAAVVAGIVATAIAPQGGARLAGAGMVALAAWLVRHDVARANLSAGGLPWFDLREGGLPRFMGACLLAGYLWLAIAGALWVAFGLPASGMLRDAALHALFLGFVFGMIFAHAPVIFPSVLGARLAYSPAFYAHVVALNATLAGRVASDVALWRPGQQWSGLGNALAIGLFVVMTAGAVLRGVLEQRSPHRASSGRRPGR